MIVISKPRKSCFNLSDFCIFGGIVPIYKLEVRRDTKTVDISPIKEFNEGNIKRIMGIVYKISSFEDNKTPVNKPNIDDNITIAIDSLIILK